MILGWHPAFWPFLLIIRKVIIDRSELPRRFQLAKLLLNLAKTILLPSPRNCFFNPETDEYFTWSNKRIFTCFRLWIVLAYRKFILGAYSFFCSFLGIVNQWCTSFKFSVKLFVGWVRNLNPPFPLTIMVGWKLEYFNTNVCFAEDVYLQ